MKFPLVTRTRLRKEVARWSERLIAKKIRLAELKSELERYKAATSDAHARLQLMDETSAKLETMTEARSAELRWLSEVERIAEARANEIEILRGQLGEAKRLHSHLLTTLVENTPEIEALSTNAESASCAIPIIVGIDVEPDSREVDREAPRWDGAAMVFEQLPGLRDQWRNLAGTEHVPLSWFVRADPQIEISNGGAGWAFEHFSQHWMAVASAGDEIGLHMHPWRWDSHHGRWLQDHRDEEWLKHCLDTALSSYCLYFGKPPTSYRGGDRFLSDELLRRLEVAGVQVDLSLERMPGATRLLAVELSDGRIPDCDEIPVSGYWPSPKDFRHPGPERTSGLGILPLTAYPAGTLPLWMAEDDFRNALRLVLRDLPELSHLAFIIRSDLILKGEWMSFCRNMELLATLVQKGGFEFTTATKAWHRVRDRLRSRDGNPERLSDHSHGHFSRGGAGTGISDSSERFGL